MATQGKNIAMNCCEAGGLTVDSGNFQAILAFMWRIQAAGFTLPTKVDVSTLGGMGSPTGSLEFDVGCDPSSGPCSSSADQYTSGFQGTIEIANGANGLDVTYCISVAESASSPHPLIHSLQLYAPHVPTP
jgi:hypothetical protein